MYITNPDILPKTNVYLCNQLVSNWLVDEMNIPLLGKSKEGYFVFSNTDLLKETLEKIPFWLKWTNILY